MTVKATVTNVRSVTFIMIDATDRRHQRNSRLKRKAAPVISPFIEDVSTPDRSVAVGAHKSMQREETVDKYSEAPDADIFFVVTVVVTDFGVTTFENRRFGSSALELVEPDWPGSRSILTSDEDTAMSTTHTCHSESQTRHPFHKYDKK